MATKSTKKSKKSGSGPVSQAKWGKMSSEARLAAVVGLLHVEREGKGELREVRKPRTTKGGKETHSTVLVAADGTEYPGGGGVWTREVVGFILGSDLPTEDERARVRAAFGYDEDTSTAEVYAALAEAASEGHIDAGTRIWQGVLRVGGVCWLAGERPASKVEAKRGEAARALVGQMFG